MKNHETLNFNLQVEGYCWQASLRQVAMSVTCSCHLYMLLHIILFESIWSVLICVAPQPQSCRNAQFVFNHLLCVPASLGCRRSLSTEPKPAMLRWQKTRRVAHLASWKECDFALHVMTWPSFWKQTHVFSTSLCQTLEFVAEAVLCQQSEYTCRLANVSWPWPSTPKVLAVSPQCIHHGRWLDLTVVLVIAKSWKMHLCYCAHMQVSYLPHRLSYHSLNCGQPIGPGFGIHVFRNIIATACSLALP